MPAHPYNHLAFSCAVTLSIFALLSANRGRERASRSTTAYGAQKIAMSLLHGPEQRFQDIFRLGKPAFCRLVRWLRDNTGLQGGRDILVEQKVMVVLWVLAHGEVQRNTAHRFGLCQATVCNIIEELLPMLVKLHQHFVRLPDDNWLDPAIELDPKLNAFNGCIGAIDGTHVAAYIPSCQQLRWFDRKSRVTQNVFAAVRSDFSFSYVLAGAEGSMNDASLCNQALSRRFKIPGNRYYLGDAGFGARDGIVVPFPGIRYHLQDWRNSSRPPETKKELYNLRHARIRVVVEQAFGQLKRRWKIIRSAPPECSLSKQAQIVYAVTGLHNFMILGDKDDGLTSAQAGLMSLARSRAQRVVSGYHSNQVRWQAAHTMWENWQRWKRRSN